MIKTQPPKEIYMLSICIVIASIAAAAYLIFKKYYAPGALLFVGLITLGVVACISPDPLITGKKATHLAGLDVIQIFTNLLQTRTAWQSPASLTLWTRSVLPAPW